MKNYHTQTISSQTLEYIYKDSIHISFRLPAGQLHDFEVRIGSNMEDLRLNHLCKEFLGTALKVSINLKCDQYYIGRYENKAQ